MRVSKEMVELLSNMCTVAEGGAPTRLIDYDELAARVHELQFLIKQCANHAEILIETCGIEQDE